MAATPRERARIDDAESGRPRWPGLREEVRDMQAIADEEQRGIKIEAWDYRYYAERVRQAKFDLDMNEVKPYLQLEKLREGMFWAAGRLVRLHLRAGVRPAVHNADVRVWRSSRNGAGTSDCGSFDP